MRIALAAAALCVSVAASGAQFRDPNHETTTPDVPALTAETSACALSTDPSYGLTKENPIKTGGGAMYMAAREVKFLTALRGPAGEGVHFKRSGTVEAADETILDAYSLDIKGERKTTLYMDGYHWSDPVAPKGFLCGAPMNLSPPGPDPFETTRQLSAIAVNLGTAGVDPISMDADGSKAHGVVYDHVRLIALAARAAAASGAPLDAASLPQPVSNPHLVAIATPLVCAGETIAPESVSLSDNGGNQPRTIGTASGGRIADLSPGLPSRRAHHGALCETVRRPAGRRVAGHDHGPTRRLPGAHAAPARQDRAAGRCKSRDADFRGGRRIATESGVRERRLRIHGRSSGVPEAVEVRADAGEHSPPLQSRTGDGGHQVTSGTISTRSKQENGHFPAVGPARHTDAFLAQTESAYRLVKACAVSPSALASFVPLYRDTPAQYNASGAGSVCGCSATTSRNRRSASSNAPRCSELLASPSFRWARKSSALRKPSMRCRSTPLSSRTRTVGVQCTFSRSLIRA